jgi:hypothetical protein
MVNESQTHATLPMWPIDRFIYAAIYNSCESHINYIVIDIVSSRSHLSHIIKSELNDDEDIKNHCSSLIGQMNSLLCYFDKLDLCPICNLYKAYCYSMYGCQVWSVDNAKIDSFSVTIRNGLRRVQVY